MFGGSATLSHLLHILCVTDIFTRKQRAYNFIKKETLPQVFSCEFYEIYKHILFKENLWATASGNKYRFQGWLLKIISCELYLLKI